MKLSGLAEHKNNSSTVKKAKKWGYGIAFLGLLGLVFSPFQKNPDHIGASLTGPDDLGDEYLGSFPVVIPTIKYGFALDTFTVTEQEIGRNETFSTLLVAQGLDMESVGQLVKNCMGVFDFTRNLKSGKEFTVLTRTVSSTPDYLVIEPNVYEYYVFHLKGDLGVRKVEREIVVKTKSVAGVINSSLWESLTEQGVSAEATDKMEDALKWSVDFSKTEAGDEFKLIYDENFIHEKAVGAGQVYAAYYKRNGKEYYAFWFNGSHFKGYYDIEGRPNRIGFLKSPVRYSRISSKYNLRRFHPILKHVRPHFGTDYAAPHGTPIMTVGDGVVEEVAFTRGNGKYVKIRHDKTYQTQYLHMSRHAKGMRKGVKVTQGQTIGYVGSTGLATGPHVCFRFWKNGRQVNHLRENLPQASQLPRAELQDFYKMRDKYLLMMKGEPFETAPSVPKDSQTNDCDDMTNP